jgi:hypothetical protein
MPWWLIMLVLHILNMFYNDTRGFCVWTWTRPLGFFLACS